MLGSIDALKECASRRGIQIGRGLLPEFTLSLARGPRVIIPGSLETGIFVRWESQESDEYIIC